MEEQDEKMTVTIADPLKIEVKVEVIDYNPWSAEHASAFLKYCCPECEYKNGTLTSFTDHALQNHENARILFANEVSSDLNWFANRFAEHKKETDYSEKLPNLLDLPKFEDNVQPETVQTSLIANGTSLEHVPIFDLEKPKLITPFWLDMPSPASSPQPPRKVPKDLKRGLNKTEQKVQYECPTCNGSFTKKWHLKKHIESIHEGKKPYSCTLCEKSFSQSSNLNRHKKSCLLPQPPTKTQKDQKCDLIKTEQEMTSAENLASFWQGMASNGINCHLCGEKILKPSEFREHKCSTIEQKMTCELCLTELKDEKMLKSHMQEHHMAEGLYCCSHCDRTCKQFMGLKYHIDIKHPESNAKKFFCNQCNKGFIYKSSVGFHMSKNTCVKHKCEICGIEYKTLTAFQVHMAKNHNTEQEPLLMCDKCDFSAPHKLLLQQHVLKKHDIDKHKKCPCCDFKTPQTQKLYIHIDNHHPEYDDKKFSCDKCGKGFIYESSSKHHTNSTCKFSDYIKNVKNPKRKLKPKKPKKTVKCDHCVDILTGSKHIKAHYKKVHLDKPIILDGIKKFPCGHCDDFFFCKVTLGRHSYLKHGIETGEQFCKKCFKPYSSQHKCHLENIHSCDHCNMTFTAKGNLKTHVLSVHEKRLDFACEHCGKMWPTLNTLKNHVRKTHTEHVNCEICDKKISNPLELRRHKVFVHKETKGAWLCVECPKSAFFSKSTFDKHMKSKH
jgi:KRAB domain-containing zinc finger protein